MPTQQLKRTAIAGGVTYEQTVSVTASQEIVTQETVPDATTDQQVNLSLDVSAMQSLHIQSTADVTLETNDGTTPADTLNVKANQPIQWAANDGTSNPLSTDVTAVFVTNASGAAATVTILALQDSTP